MKKSNQSNNVNNVHTKKKKIKEIINHYNEFVLHKNNEQYSLGKCYSIFSGKPFGNIDNTFVIA